MVRSGTISGDVADKWTERIKNLDTIKEHREKAEAGDVISMRHMGFAYRDGKLGLAIDKRLAIEWFRKAADKGEITACDSLGGLVDTPTLKVYWFTLAAAQGSEFASFMLGEAFKYGRFGLPRDRQMAKAWFTKMSEATVRNGAKVRDDGAKALRELSGE
jgi:TPR repeat protein